MCIYSIGSVCEFRTAQCKIEQISMQGINSVQPLTLAHDGECQIDTSQLYKVRINYLESYGITVERKSKK